jgi:hypothetical protein
MAELGQSPGDALNEFKSNLNIPLETQYALDNMVDAATKLNTLFGQTRQRAVELMQTFADSVPGITRLGGGIEDVSRTLEDIAKATRKNVAAQSEDVKDLFAVYKLTGEDVKSVVDDFANVGVNFTKIGGEVQKSYEYLSNMGLNAQQVFGNVLDNMEQMNRFQFVGGVDGLTKMAAQASMLRFNMNETFKLADKVLTPEGAIQTAAAFQRLGVAAGDLVDPFQLMNQSINDPSGLQDSLVNVAKQFTYFDEKTQSFKINPQGVLTLKEMEKETGVSAAEMSKLGLAAAEMDKKLSQINPRLSFEDDDDRQLLANIATMDKKTGEFKVNYTDVEGKTQAIKLNELSEDQTKRIIEQQKNAPKDLESIARSQLNVGQLALADIGTIKNKIVYGIASTDQVRVGYETVRKFSDDLLGSLSKNFPDVKETRDSLTNVVNNTATLLKEAFTKGDKKKEDEALENLRKQFSSFGPRMSEFIDNSIKDFKKLQANSNYAMQEKTSKLFLSQDEINKYKKEREKVEVTGKVNVDFTSSTNVFGGLTQNQIEELLKKPAFVEAMTKLVHEKWPEMYYKKT